MTFKLDTSGIVGGGQGVHDTGYEWPDLSPFVQGNVEAALNGPVEGWDWDNGIIPRFSDLAPETLTRIMEDCARAPIKLNWGPRFEKFPEECGKYFWEARQRDGLIDFPLLTLYLADDGKIRIKE